MNMKPPSRGTVWLWSRTAREGLARTLVWSAPIVTALLLLLPAPSSGFSYLGVARGRSLSSGTAMHGELPSSDVDAIDASALLEEVRALRAQASHMQLELDRAKEERIRKRREKVDALIDALLFHGLDGPGAREGAERSRAELLRTEEQVASLLISKRLNYDLVNQMFDRICEQSQRPQSCDSCSPLLSLLLDAACQVDGLERSDNPNKRWNHRVERDLRRKLFALGCGIRIEDVDAERRRARSITGERDYS